MLIWPNTACESFACVTSDAPTKNGFVLTVNSESKKKMPHCQKKTSSRSREWRKS